MTDSTNPIPDTTVETASAETPVIIAPANPTAPTPSAKWLAAIQPLVERLEMTPEAVTTAIVSARLVKAPTDASADSLTDPDAIADADFAGAFPDAAKGDLKKAVKEMRAVAAPNVTPPPLTPIASQMLAQQPSTVVSQYLIPDLPETESLLTALSASKTLTIDALTIRAALEAFHADSMNLSEVPENIVRMMETHADMIEEPVGEKFTEVLRFVRERKYADVNVDSRLVTKERKAVFMRKLTELPSSVRDFHAVLSSWNENLRTNRSANPFGVLSGANFWPAPDDVIAASEGVVACLKKVFAGLGVHVARALAYEAIKIRETVESPDLPTLTGQVNKELMLKALGCNLTNADVRLERNIAKYILFVATKVPTDLPGGQEGAALEALWNLGQMIQPWMNDTSRASQSRETGSPYPIGSGDGPTRSRRDPR
jgi:hypothetical protein